MSPWSENKHRRWPVYGGLALIVLGMVVGYLLMTGVTDGGDRDAGPGTATPGVAASSPAATDGAPEGDVAETADEPDEPELEVVSWGQASGQLAVEVRNRSAATIEQLRVRITAVDSSGATVVSTTGTEPDVCCTVVGLPPGKSFGLFVDLRTPAPDIAAVEVEPVSTEPASARRAPRVVARQPRLERHADDTVVTAALFARGGAPVRYVAVQAFLVDRNGQVGQVISGRFCLGPARTREVRLHLFHAVPAALRLDRVVAYGLPAGVRPYLPWKCR